MSPTHLSNSYYAREFYHGRADDRPIMIPKKGLKHGCYYAGECRNASVARWDTRSGVFRYNRYKFGFVHVESIKHPEDELDSHWDCFEPSIEIPEPDDPIVLP